LALITIRLKKWRNFPDLNEKTMRLTVKFMCCLVFACAGCNQEPQKEAETTHPVLAAPALETLEQAKQVEGVLQDAAQQQQEAIDAQTK
jgi:hypothetical protein